MNSFKEAQRQIRIAIAALATILPIGVVGFMLLEHFSLLDSIWLTVITLATIGYGDIYAHTTGGRIFTVLLILFGLGTVAYGLQATANFIVSPAVRDLRQRRNIISKIQVLSGHYIICGAGELVNDTITYLIEGARLRQKMQLDVLYRPIDKRLDSIFGTPERRRLPRLRAFIRGVITTVLRMRHRQETLLDVLVVVTPHHDFAELSRDNGLLVIEGDPTSESMLRRAGIERAQAMMIMLDRDTETLISVLTARSLNPRIEITAAALDEALTTKMIRVGANDVIAPYEVAGRFLNNATMRPAVNEFFNSILFSQRSTSQTTLLHLWDDSTWIGQTLADLNLRQRFGAAIIGLRLENGGYVVAPGQDYRLNEGESLIAVVPNQHIAALQAANRESATPRPRGVFWQRLPTPQQPPIQTHRVYTLEEAALVIKEMHSHYVICGSNRVARSAISKLDPLRPFVIISDNASYAQELLQKGFRVIYGNPAEEATIQAAGVERALAVMVAIEDQAASIMTILNCRAFSKRLLITAAAQTDDMLPKLLRTGADRVLSPFQVAAQFVLLATTRPAISDFLQHVVYNYAAQIETTELYMQHDSPWIGRTIESLTLKAKYNADVISVRDADGRYTYAPPPDHCLAPDEVLIVVTPMSASDALREQAHGSITKRPLSLRRGYFEGQHNPGG